MITNLTRGTILATSAETARSPWTRFLGLMGRSYLPIGAGLVLPGTKGVHTHFMRFPIDVVFYGRDGVVLDVVESLPPWRFSPYRFRAGGVVELPAGAARASATRPGDVLAISSGAEGQERGTGNWELGAGDWGHGARHPQPQPQPLAPSPGPA